MGRRYDSWVTGLCLLLAATACQGEKASTTSVFEGETSTPLSSSDNQPTHTPWNTAAPPTLRPTATLLGLDDIILRETFADGDTCMETFDREAARAAVEDGGFVIEVHAPDEVVNANCETLVASDFILEVDATVQEFEAGGAYYFGVLLRVSGDERYAFVIGSEGGYCVYYAKDEAFIPLTSSTDFGGQCWTHLPQNAKVEGTQRIRVEALADRMDIYLNGELLAVVRDGQLRSGWVGFVAATSGEGGLQVVFDNLVISIK